MSAKIDRQGKEGRANRSGFDVYKKELGLEYRRDKTHFIEYTLEGFKEELEKVGLRISDYSIQFGEIWAG